MKSVTKRKINWKEVEKDFKRQDAILERWVTRNYGKRCPTYCKDCILCKKWRLFDKLRLRVQAKPLDIHEKKIKIHT